MKYAIGIKVAALNIQSARKNKFTPTNELPQLVNNHSIDILIISESKLKSNHPPPTLPQYTPYNVPATITDKGGISGGLIAYVKDNLVPDTTINVIHSNIILISIPKYSIAILGLYIPPDNNENATIISDIFTHLSDYTTTLNQMGQSVLLIGDDNVRYGDLIGDKDRNERANMFEALLDNAMMVICNKQLIKNRWDQKVTFQIKRNNTWYESIPDHAYITSDLTNYTTFKVIKTLPSTSDHHLIMCDINTTDQYSNILETNELKRVVPKYSYVIIQPNQKNHNLWTKAVNEFNLVWARHSSTIQTNQTDINNISLIYQEWYCTFLTVLNTNHLIKSYPFIDNNNSKYHDKYIDSIIKLKLQSLQKLKYDYYNGKNQQNSNAILKQINLLKHQIDLQYLQNINESLCTNYDDTKKFWSIINQLNKNDSNMLKDEMNNIIHDSTKISTKFAQHYANLLCDKSDQVNLRYNKEVNNLFQKTYKDLDDEYNPTITPNDISIAIANSNKKATGGLSGLNIRILSLLNNSDSPNALLDICQLITRVEIPPRACTIAVIINLKKKHNAMTTDKYRGIQLSDSLIKLVIDGIQFLYEAPKIHKQLSTVQGGFIPYRSHLDQLQTKLTLIHDNCILQKPLFMVELDISKAFDSILSSQMLLRLYHLVGSRGKRWRLRYFESRTQMATIRTQVGNCSTFSQLIVANGGTKQGGTSSGPIYIVTNEPQIREILKQHEGAQLITPKVNKNNISYSQLKIDDQDQIVLIQQHNEIIPHLPLIIFADDTSISANSAIETQKMLCLFVNEFEKLNLKLNVDKTMICIYHQQFMSDSDKDFIRLHGFTAYNKTIKITDKCKTLGLILKMDTIHQDIGWINNIDKTNKVYYDLAARGILNHNNNKYNNCNIINTKLMALLTQNAEILFPPSNCLIKIHQAQNHIIKQQLNLTKNSHSIIARRLFGIPSAFQICIHKALRHHRRILLLSDFTHPKNICKQHYLRFIQDMGNITTINDKYNPIGKYNILNLDNYPNFETKLNEYQCELYLKILYWMDLLQYISPVNLMNISKEKWNNMIQIRTEYFQLQYDLKNIRNDKYHNITRVIKQKLALFETNDINDIELSDIQTNFFDKIGKYIKDMTHPWLYRLIADNLHFNWVNIKETKLSINGDKKIYIHPFCKLCRQSWHGDTSPRQHLLYECPIFDISFTKENKWKYKEMNQELKIRFPLA